jgi:phosphoenolpyruvate mutase/phosphonopyruvate decarboxylase
MKLTLQLKNAQICKKQFSSKLNAYYKHIFHNDDKKSTKLRKMLYSKDELFHMMEAHSGLSAKIVERTGFPAIWGSGLSISAQLGLRDSNEASWTQVVDVCDFINQAVNLPVLLDGDTGFGNFNNARRLVNRLELLGIAGVCIEDKLFPKTNSFIDKGAPQELADIDEFCLKISACKDAQKDPDFCIVARVEALIADHGVEEAIKRANAYYKAGADAILIHSKKAKADEIREFLKIWNKRHPVVIVPTKYAMDTDAEEMRSLGVNLMIWANHNVRASVKAMKEVSEKIWNNKHCGLVEKEIASVNDIFDLQGEDALAHDEKLYLPQNKKDNLKKSDLHNNTTILGNTHIKQETHGTSSKVPHFSTSTKVNPEEKSKPGISPTKFIQHIRNLGIKFVTGVPDSLMNNFIEHLPKADDRSDTLYHHVSVNEGAALAMAAGFQVGANKDTPTVIYLQNSGLGNIINPLLSLTHKEVYSIPVVIIVGWRGDPTDYTIKDEPQHKVQGRYMLDMIKAMGLDFFILPRDSDQNAQKIFSSAVDLCKKKQQPVFVVVKADTFQKFENAPKTVFGDEDSLLSRREAVEAAHNLTRDFAARVSTTGKLSRELYEINMKETNQCKDFLMVGSMGHVFSFTQGLCHSGIKGNVACFDGDGSILMHTGSLSSVSSLPPRTKILHIGFNNRLHESVGLQPTAFKNSELSLSGIAKSMGYTKVFKITQEFEAKKIIEEFKSLEESKDKPITYFIEWLITTDKANNKIKSLSRPKETPSDRKKVFLRSLPH